MLNRRGFLDTLLKGTAAFAILPPALTYARQWKYCKDKLLYCCCLEEGKIVIDQRVKWPIQWEKIYVGYETNRYSLLTTDYKMVELPTINEWLAPDGNVYRLETLCSET